ncbi:MAG: hypothetical protein ACI4VM_06175 [Anaerovoracaceae bacterium]
MGSFGGEPVADVIVAGILAVFCVLAVRKILSGVPGGGGCGGCEGRSCSRCLSPSAGKPNPAEECRNHQDNHEKADHRDDVI